MTTLRQEPATDTRSRPQDKGLILAGWLSSTDHKVIGHMYRISFLAPGGAASFGWYARMRR